MKNVYFLSFFSILCICSATGYPSEAVGGHGFVQTKSDVLEGFIRIDFDKDLVVVKNGSRYQHLVASQIKKVILETELGPIGYCSAVFGMNGYKLFQILSEGQVTLLYREDLGFSEFEDKGFPPFFILSEGSVYSVSSKKEFLSHFTERAAEVRDFIKREHISFKSKDDLIVLFDFYNGVQNRSEMLALDH